MSPVGGWALGVLVCYLATLPATPWAAPAADHDGTEHRTTSGYFDLHSKYAKKVTLPQIIFQYGVPRSASTLQYMMLEWIAHMLDTSMPVRGLFIGDPTSLQTALNSRKARYVLKVHPSSKTPNILTDNATWPEEWTSELREAAVFVSATSNDPWANQTEAVQYWQEQLGRQVMYVQLSSQVASQGYHIAIEYAKVLGLNDKQLTVLVAKARYWSILRQCCGSQMSKDYLKMLHGGKSSRSMVSPTYPACEIYDIDAVQKAFMAIGGWFKGCPGCGNMRFNCSRSNQWIAETKAEFNAVFPCHICDPVV